MITGVIRFHNLWLPLSQAPLAFQCIVCEDKDYLFGFVLTRDCERVRDDCWEKERSWEERVSPD